jgi:catechol 2,3-dioxygenase-like lactoylglutathione lyase family enzyme
MTGQTWPTSIGAMTLFCEDLAASKAFYAEFLAAAPVWGDAVSSVFRAGETMINLLQVAAVAELIHPAPMAAPGVRAVYTLSVPDVDLEADRLRAAGLALLNGPMDRPWGIRTASLQDPSGHVWELAAPLQRKTDRT